jgi:hypothetical protein
MLPCPDFVAMAPLRKMDYRRVVFGMVIQPILRAIQLIRINYNNQIRRL